MRSRVRAWPNFRPAPLLHAFVPGLKPEPFTTLRKLHLTSSLADFPMVAFGSIATEMGCPRYVRFSPVSDRRTDIAECLRRANSGSPDSRARSRAPANREAGAGWPDYRKDIYQANHAVRSSLLLPEALPIMKG